jgi:hypothetical protein
MVRRIGRGFGVVVFACAAGVAVPHAMAAPDARAGGAARTERPAPVEEPLREQLRRQNDRIQALEAELDYERRRAEAVAAYANKRVADAIAATEQRAGETAADLQQLRAEYEREVGALQRLFEDASRRASEAERSGLLWGGLALPIGAAIGWLVRRRREEPPPPSGRRSFTPGEFAAFLSRRRTERAVDESARAERMVA